MSALEGEETTTDKKDDANQKDQLDEVLALESIYSATPEYFSYNVDKDCKVSGSITIVLPKIDKEIVVCADKKSIHINHLPPLLLRFSFPSDYPSYSMPQFSLQTIWLDSTEMLRLSNILTNSWTDFRGMPILFTWVEMLKEEAMQIIVSHPIINLAEISAKENSPNDALELLKTFTEYEEQAVQTEFESNWYDCEVCFSSSSGKECIRFMFCGHIFCTDCVSSYYHQKLKDNMVPQFECLSEGCDSAATQVQIRQVLTVKEFEIYEQRLLEGTLDLMADVFICPRLSCQAPVIADDIQSSNGSSLASCSLCHYSFCILCRKTYHGIEPCRLSSEVRDKLLQQLETATEPQREQIYKRFGGRKQFERQIEAMKSERWIDANSKPCPNCRANIEKNNGCNKMTCSKCKNHFCWLCGMLLDQKDPYRHFNMAGSKSCFNRLFEGLQDEDDWFLGSSDSDGDE